MTNKEAVNWIINLSADIGKSEHSELWHYEQALYEIREILESAQQWIPCSERLPEEDKEVLITYKGKGDELDKPYSNIDITTYGQMYFGGNKVGNYKHWRSPFQYFNDNYEVTAWMPLPEPYAHD